MGARLASYIGSLSQSSNWFLVRGTSPENIRPTRNEIYHPAIE